MDFDSLMREMVRNALEPSDFVELTVCCNAYEKGTEDGVCCRACYTLNPRTYKVKRNHGLR